MSVFLTANILNTINSTSITTGALTVNGGVGVGKNLNVGGLTNIASTTANQLTLGYDASNKVTFDVSSSGDLTIDATGNDINFSTTDTVNILNTTNSASTATGALQVSGGFGVGNSIYAGNSVNVTGNSATNNVFASFIGTINTASSANLTLGTANSNYNSAILKFNNAGGTGSSSNYLDFGIYGATGTAGGVSIYGDGHVTSTSTIGSSNTSTGSLVVNSGVGIGKDVYVGGIANITSTTSNQLSVGYDASNKVTMDVSSGGDLTVDASGNDINFANTDIIHILNTATTTSTSTGVLVVGGGVGIAKDVFIDGYTNIDNSVENHQSFVGLDGSHATFISSFRDNLEADYARGSRYVTATNGTISLSNGKLTLGSGTGNYVRYAATNNASFTQQGTIRFKVTPNYTGTPANNVFINIGTVSDLTNGIWLYHASSTNIALTIKNSSNAFIIQDVGLGAWVPITGNEYEFELDIDISNGITRLFVDGKQFGTTQTATGIRTNTATTIQVGDWIGGTNPSNFSMRDLEIFDNVQHTTSYQVNSYTPNYTTQYALTTYGLNASGPTNLSNLNVEGQQEVKFLASYASSLTADYGLGSTLVAGTSGTYSISGGKLVLGSGQNNYIRYVAASNANMTYTGTIRFKYTPNYSVMPAGDVNIFNIGTPTNYSWVDIYHVASNSNLAVIITADNGTNIIITALGAWTWTSGTEYEFELDFDVSNGGISRLFVNGTQFGSNMTTSGSYTRTGIQQYIQVGAGMNVATHYTNFSIRDLIIYNTVQHTSAYTPGYSTESVFTTHISGPTKILGPTIMNDVNITGRIDSYNSNNLMRNTFSNTTLGTRAVSTWTTRAIPASNDWLGLCWSPELGIFCAVSFSGSGNRVMTSPDGIIWTTRSYPVENSWTAVCWSPELNILCAVGGTSTGNGVMTSPDGVTWTSRASAANNSWERVVWAPELGIFCAISWNGTGNRVMTSPDGITWTTRSTSGIDNAWSGLCWAPELGLFCAVAGSGTAGTFVMTSSDGITWTTRASTGDNGWRGVCWSPELNLFCAAGESGTGSRIMTSPDGITWTARPCVANTWRLPCWSPELGLFCVIGITGTGNRVMTSEDGIIWTTRASAADNNWYSISWSSELGIFCCLPSVAASGMTSKKVYDKEPPSNTSSFVQNSSGNITVAGSLNVSGGVGINGVISSYKDGGLYYQAYDNYSLTSASSWNNATGRILQCGVTSTLNITNPSYGGQTDYFAVRIMGWIKPLYSQTYTFELTSTDDAAILFIANQEIVRGSGGGTSTGTIALTANQWIPIYLEWAEATGSSVLRVQWSSSSQTKGDIQSIYMRYCQFDNAPSVLGTSIVNGMMTISRKDASTSTSTGSLIVAGGIGVNGAIYNNDVINSTISTGSAYTTAMQLYNSGLSANYNHSFTLGVASSTLNEGNIYFEYAGSGSTNNNLGFQLNGYGGLFKVYSNRIYCLPQTVVSTVVNLCLTGTITYYNSSGVSLGTGSQTSAAYYYFVFGTTDGSTLNWSPSYTNGSRLAIPYNGIYSLELSCNTNGGEKTLYISKNCGSNNDTSTGGNLIAGGDATSSTSEETIRATAYLTTSDYINIGCYLYFGTLNANGNSRGSFRATLIQRTA